LFGELPTDPELREAVDRLNTFFNPVTPPQLAAELTATERYRRRVIDLTFDKYLRRDFGEGMFDQTSMPGRGAIDYITTTDPQVPRREHALAYVVGGLLLPGTFGIEYREFFGAGNDTVWLRSLTMDALDRNSTPADAQALQDAKESGASLENFALTVFAGEEYRRRLILDFYETVVRRPRGQVSEPEVESWLGYFGQGPNLPGRTIEQVLSAFFGAAEYRSWVLSRAGS
jgi:hypothetical protein